MNGVSATPLSQAITAAIGTADPDEIRKMALGKELTVQQAFTAITAALKENTGPGSYRDSWLANIAVPILDQKTKLDLTTHEGANKMAEILLKHFFDA